MGSRVIIQVPRCTAGHLKLNFMPLLEDLNPPDDRLDFKEPSGEPWRWAMTTPASPIPNILEDLQDH